MTHGNERPEEIASPAISSGEQLLEQIALTADRKITKDLGNSECLERWRKKKVFASAQGEWLGGWKRFARTHGLETLLRIHAGVQHDPEPIRSLVLAMLRLSDKPQEVLKKQAPVIDAAVREGDVEFFKKLNLALKSRGGRGSGEAESSFLAFNILRYWFAGLLWLMNDKEGCNALSAYTGNKIETAAYRKARLRLGLRGHKDRMRRPPVLEFDPVTRSYKYRS